MQQLLWTALLLLVTALWGWTFIVVKQATAAYSVTGFLAIRFLIAAATLGLLCARRITWRTLRLGLGIGLVMSAGYFCQTLGLRHTSATNSGLITGLFVLFAPLFARLLFGARSERSLLLSAILSIVGLVLLTGPMPGELRWAAVGRGDLITLGCAVAFGLQIALLSRYAAGHDALVLAFGQLLAAAILFPLMWPACDVPQWPSPAIWRSLLLMGILASALAFYVQTKVQQHLSAMRTAIILGSEPLFAALFAWWLAGERLSSLRIAGALLVFAAVMVETITSLRNPDREQRPADASPASASAG